MAEEIGGKLIRELRVVDLKKELEARSLSKTGSKKDLVERLKSVSEFSSIAGVAYTASIIALGTQQPTRLDSVSVSVTPVSW